MQELIETIRAAVASDASNEKKAAGATACRAILTALDTEPGKPLTFPGTPPTQTMSRVPIDQILDLMIARLGVIAKEREDHQALPAQATPTQTLPPPAASRGLRVPMATSNALKVPARSANPVRATPPKPAVRPGNVRPVTARKP